jgi:hypothetical protein
MPINLKSVLRPDLDPGFLPNPDQDSCVLLYWSCLFLGTSHCNGTAELVNPPFKGLSHEMDLAFDDMLVSSGPK